MRISFDPFDPRDREHVEVLMRATAGGVAPAAPSAPPAAPAAPSAPPAAPAAPSAPPAPAGQPTDEHETVRRQLTDVTARLGPAGQQVGALIRQCGAESVSGLTLEQLRWVLVEAQKIQP